MPTAAFADTPPAECPAVEDVAVEPVGEVLLLTDEEPGGGQGQPQCSHVSGCGFTPSSPFSRTDAYCAIKCPSACTGYDTGYYEEASSCCICIAV